MINFSKDTADTTALSYSSVQTRLLWRADVCSSLLRLTFYENLKLIKYSELNKISLHTLKCKFYVRKCFLKVQ